MNKLLFTLTFCLAASYQGAAQTFVHYTTTEASAWSKTKAKLSTKVASVISAEASSTNASSRPLLQLTELQPSHEFRGWGTCFNELDLDALELLTPAEQEAILHDLFAPNGDLRFTRGRLTMNANDYSRSWYSCDTVSGDFELNHFNIEHDKQNIIRLIHMAQRHQPALTFWMSPWSPPAWMKINQDYPVLSSRFNHQPKEKDALLYAGAVVGSGATDIDPDEMKLLGDRNGVFPRRLATQDYMIQDPRYLQAYANMFCRFIDLYREEGVPIDMVMYQNEAYSYTPYPGCAWTPGGAVRFNRDYLAPTLAKNHPDVKLYIGTFNTNRLDCVEWTVDGVKDCVSGIGLQWEGRDNIAAIRKRYPDLHLISSESECGNGSMDWRAGEHTFHLLADYIGQGCDEYFIWNFILTDNGQSTWGWRQNALIQVDSKNRQYRYTAEYYAVKHFSHFVEPGSRMVFYRSKDKSNGLPVIVFVRPNGKRVVIAGNLTDNGIVQSIKIGKRYLNMTLSPHSFNTFSEQ